MRATRRDRTSTAVVQFTSVVRSGHRPSYTTSPEDLMNAIIAKAALHGIELTPADFIDYGDGPTLDGMDAAEWLEAMTMD